MQESFLLVRATRKASPSTVHVFLSSLGLPLTLAIVVCNNFLFTTLTRNLGVSITPIVASLGITSLALALQPTLENFFSGLQLIFDKPIRVGDFIELDSGEQGFVEKIGWRSPRIKCFDFYQPR